MFLPSPKLLRLRIEQLEGRVVPAWIFWGDNIVSYSISLTETSNLTVSNAGRTFTEVAIGIQYDANFFTGSPDGRSVTLKPEFTVSSLYITLGNQNDRVLLNEDSPSCGWLDCFAGNDVVGGGNGWDNIMGGAGSDYIDGRGGDDALSGSGGAINVWELDLADEIYGGPGNDAINGVAGDDELYGGDGNDIISGGDDFDQIYGGPDNDQLYGDGDDDILIGNGGDDKLYGGALNDTLWGGEPVPDSTASGKDTLQGNDGNDALSAGDDNDELDGGDHDDGLKGEQGVDKLTGGAGSDVFNGGIDIDVFMDYVKGTDTWADPDQPEP